MYKNTEKTAEIQAESKANGVKDSNVDGQELVRQLSHKEIIKFLKSQFEGCNDQIIQLIQECLKKGKKRTSTLDEVLEQFSDVIKSDVVKKLIENYYQSFQPLYNFYKLHKVEQIKAYLKCYYPSLKRNVISQKIEIEGEYQREIDLNTIMFDLQVFGAKISKNTFYDFLNSNHTPSYHPIMEFFKQNKDLKPSGNIKALADCINSPTGTKGESPFPEYKEVFLKRWLVGVVASIYGAKNNLFPIVTGGQNTGKTEFWRRLMPIELKRYCSESKLDQPNESDISMIMCENLLVGDDEMSGKSKKDWRKLKNLLDKDVFTTRKPYGKGTEQTKRLASFWGTTNEMELLGDPTGNRRLIPIEVVSINHAAYNAIDKKALWLEVYHLFQNGESWNLSKEEIKLLNDNTHEFAYSDPITDAITETFEIPKEDEPRHICQLTATQIANKIKHLVTGSFRCEAVGIRMKNLGFSQKIVKKKGMKVNQRIYEVIEVFPQKNDI